LLSLTACGRPAPAASLDWMLGDWHGVRRDGSDGSEAPMTSHIASIDAGPGQVERVHVAPEGGEPYTGFAVRVPAATGGGWVMLYANSARETFARLEGVVATNRVTWRSVTPGRERESGSVVERLDANHWRRTQRVSEDGGRTWRVLFVDELRRDE
jgi:hypothetical protein